MATPEKIVRLDHIKKGLYLESVRLPIREIKPSSENQRLRFDPEVVKDLIESIRRWGLLQPILVQPSPLGGYEVVDGHTRLLACNNIGLKTVDTRMLSETLPRLDLEIVQLEVNGLRRDPSPYDLTLKAGRIQAQTGDYRKTAEVMGWSAEGTKFRLLVAELNSDLLARCVKRNIPHTFVLETVRRIGTKKVCRHLKLSRDEIVGHMVEKCYAKSVPQPRGSTRVFRDIARCLYALDREDALFWLTNPKRGLEMLLAMAGEAEHPTDQTASNIYKKLGHIQKDFGILKDVRDITSIPEKTLDGISDRIKALRDDYTRLRKRWTNQIGRRG